MLVRFGYFFQIGLNLAKAEISARQRQFLRTSIQGPQRVEARFSDVNAVQACRFFRLR